MFALIAVFVSFATMTVSKKLTAGFSGDEIFTHVEIDGEQYGSFNPVNNLDEIISLNYTDRDYSVITLSRNFITDRSLYVWARETTSKREGLKNIHLVMRDKEGNERSRYVLKLCQPISWSLETADPSTGGFYEKISLTVQEVEIN